jgi:hypothetical protein
MVTLRTEELALHPNFPLQMKKRTLVPGLPASPVTAFVLGALLWAFES